MGQIKPQRALLTIWRIYLSVGMIFPAFLNALFFPIRGTVWLVLTAVWVILFLGLYTLYLPLCYRKLSFSVTEDRILLYNGGIYTRVRSIPLQNIQFTTIYRNPFHLLFGVCSLAVTAAGGRINLPGIPRPEAERLAQALLEKRR